MATPSTEWTIDDRIGDAARLYFGAMKRYQARLRRIGRRAPTVFEGAGLCHLYGLAEGYKDDMRFWKDVKARGWTVAWETQKRQDAKREEAEARKRSIGPTVQEAEHSQQGVGPTVQALEGREAGVMVEGLPGIYRAGGPPRARRQTGREVHMGMTGKVLRPRVGT